MRRRAALAALLVAGLTACGGAEETRPLPEDVEGTVARTTTEQQGGGGGGTGEQGGANGQQGGGGGTGEQGGGGGEQGGGGGEQGGGQQGDPAAGKEVFASAGCGSCHTLSDAGASGTVGPNLDESKPDYELALERVTNGKDAMPAFKGQLSDKEIEDVATYVVQATEG